MQIVSAVMIWNVLKLGLNTSSPVAVVLSGSMEPSMYRGDVIILHKFTEIIVGDIIVYELEGQDIPIVHRIMAIHEEENPNGEPPALGDYSRRKYLTKGDNNYSDDRPLYKRGKFYLNEKQIIGKVFMIIPNVGYLTIILNDYPLVKAAFLGSMFLSVFLSKEPVK